MKMFVFAALIAVAAAGRLEHLERSYLPPDNNAAGSNFGSHSSFGSNSAVRGSFGSHSQSSNSGSFGGHSGSFGGRSGSFGGHSGSFGDQSGAFGAAGASQPSFNAGAFPDATSNQYLPPNHGSASSASQGFGAQNFHAQPSRYQAASQQYSVPSTQYGIPAGPSSFSQPRYQPQSQFGGANQQSGAASRQYLAPRVDSSNNIPQQAFDEETGYHY